jgi:hypothetical protein
VFSSGECPASRLAKEPVARTKCRAYKPCAGPFPSLRLHTPFHVQLTELSPKIW